MRRPDLAPEAPVANRPASWTLAEDPAAIVEALLEALRAGATPVQLAGEVTYAAARRIA